MGVGRGGRGFFRPTKSGGFAMEFYRGFCCLYMDICECFDLRCQ